MDNVLVEMGEIYENTQKLKMLTESDNISKDKLIEYLKEINKPTPVTFVAVTIPQMKKTNNPYLGIKKTSTINGMAGADYESQVRTQMLRQGLDPMEFKAGPTSAGMKRVSAVLAYHEEKNKYYLIVSDIRSGSAVYELNGQIIDKELLKPFLYEPKPATKQLQAGVAPENAISHHRYSIDNIKSININGLQLTVI
jgi:hypothetical protein